MKFRTIVTLTAAIVATPLAAAPVSAAPSEMALARAEAAKSDTLRSDAKNDAKGGLVRTLVLGDVSFMDDLTPILNDLTGKDDRFDHKASGVWNLRDGLPSFELLGKFDSVLAFTDSVSVNFTDLSNLLGKYVVGGGGVVIGTFWGQEGGRSDGLLNSHGFNPLINPTFEAYQENKLGEYDAKDPLLQGVRELYSSTYNGDYEAGLDKGATLAASWSDGRPLAAYNADRTVAAITLYPNVVTFGHAEGDYRPLFANALALTAGDTDPVGGVPEPATWALMLGGFGLVGGVLRRRTAVPAFA